MHKSFARRVVLRPVEEWVYPWCFLDVSLMFPCDSAGEEDFWRGLINPDFWSGGARPESAGPRVTEAAPPIQSRGLRYEPPPPLASLELLRCAVRDHCLVGLNGEHLRPKVARLACRADIVTLTQFLQSGVRHGAATKDLLMWLALLHKVHRRSPIATAQQKLMDTSWCYTRERAAEIALLLEDRFEPKETTFDVLRPGVGGIVALKFLLQELDVLELHIDRVCQMPPKEWTISALMDSLGNFKRVLSPAATYIRGHHARTLSFFADFFDALAAPEMTAQCWNSLLDSLPGTRANAELANLEDISKARVAVVWVNRALETLRPRALEAYGRFTLLDLSCLLCLAAGQKATYHKDEGRPYEVRIELLPKLGENRLGMMRKRLASTEPSGAPPRLKLKRSKRKPEKDQALQAQSSKRSRPSAAPVVTILIL